MPAKLETVIKAALQADVPVLLWGAPGTCKTATIQSMAKAEGAHLETLIGSTLDPSEVGGIPFPVAGELKRSHPDWAMRLRRALDEGREAWLFLDELSCAPGNVQAALLRVVQERKVGSLDLTGIRVVAAANPADTAADGGFLTPAMANRWLHLTWSVDATEWCSGELAGWGKDRNQHERSAASLVTGWIQRKSESLCPPTPGDAADLRGHPSPRAWSSVVKAMGALGGGREVLGNVGTHLVVSGLVGVGAADEFLTWARALDLPNPEEVLSGKAKLPSRGDQIMTVLNEVVSCSLKEHANRTHRVELAWKVLAKVRPDLAAVPARVLAETEFPIPDEAALLAKRLRTAQEAVAA